MARIALGILIGLSGVAPHTQDSTELTALDADALGRMARSFCAPRNFVANQDQCRVFIEELQTTEFEPSRSKEANLVLAEAYGDLAMSTTSQREQTEARSRQYAIFERLLTNAPDDIEILKRYAYAQQDEDKRASILREVLNIEPRDVTAHWILGLNLMGRGDEGSMLEGLDHLRAAYANAEGAWKLQMAAEVYTRLGASGFAKEAEDFKRQLQTDLRTSKRVTKAERSVESSQAVDAVAAVVQDLVGTFCHSQYLLVEQGTCMHALTLVDKLKERAPEDAAVLALALDAHQRLLKGTFTADGKSEAMLGKWADKLLDAEPDQGDLAVLQRIINDNPDVSSAVRASFAEVLVKAGRRAEAIDQLRKAFDGSSSEQKRRFGKRLVNLLQEEQRQSEADAIIRRMQQM
ncbi:MAG: hypothetical protein ACREX3_04425 [Gammaproteobacteria bacterium]